MQWMKTLTAVALLVGSGSSAAIELSILPSAAQVRQGDSVSVAIFASGLGDYAPPSLGAYLVRITFDAAILDYVSVVYGNLLGNPTDSLETTTTGLGWVSLDEFSWLSDKDLDALQPAGFTLATLTFRGQAVGGSALSFGTLDLSDALGNTLTPTAVTGGDIQVPVPATTVLILPFALRLARRHRCS